MPARSSTELERFHQFQEGLLAHGRNDLSPEEVLRLWRAQQQEYSETAEAIREGLQDIEAGRVKPFGQFDQEFRGKYNIPHDA